MNQGLSLIKLATYFLMFVAYYLAFKIVPSPWIYILGLITFLPNFFFFIWREFFKKNSANFLLFLNFFTLIFSIGLLWVFQNIYYQLTLVLLFCVGLTFLLKRIKGDHSNGVIFTSNIFLIAGLALSFCFHGYIEQFQDIVKAHQAVASGKPLEARKRLLIAYKKSISKVPILLELATLEEHLGNHLKAIRYLELAIRLSPNEALLLKLANLYFENGDDKKALRSVASAVKINPHSEQAYLALVNLFLKKGEDQNALITARAWVNALPKSVKAKQTLEKLDRKR